MSSQKEVNETFIKTEVGTEEQDAVHPRFSTTSEEEIREYQFNNDYFCEPCNEYFAPTTVGLQTHFKGDMVKHKPYGSCIYCNGNVYQYKFKGNRQIYHDCKRP